MFQQWYKTIQQYIHTLQHFNIICIVFLYLAKFLYSALKPIKKWEKIEIHFYDHLGLAESLKTMNWPDCWYNYKGTYLPDRQSVAIGVGQRHCCRASHYEEQYPWQLLLHESGIGLDWGIYISFQIEWDMIVVTVFLPILNQRNSILFKIERKTVTTIISHLIWKEIEH